MSTNKHRELFMDLKINFILITQKEECVQKILFYLTRLGFQDIKCLLTTHLFLYLTDFNATQFDSKVTRTTQ